MSKRLKIIPYTIVIASILLAAFISSSLVNAGTSQNSQIKSSKKTIVIKEKTQLEAFAKENEIPLLDNGHKLSEIVIVKTVPNTTTNLKPKSDISYGWDDWTVLGGWKVNLIDTGEACGTETIRTTTDTGPSELICTVNMNLPVKCDYINNGGEIVPELVNECVGYNVKEKFPVNDTKKLTLKSNERAQIIATTYLQVKHFEILRSPGFGMGYKLDNKGAAQKPIGVCFRVYRW